MARQGTTACYGLGVLLCRGVAAWMEVASKAPEPARCSAQDSLGRPPPLPGGLNAEAVHVLAAMTLEHLQEVSL